MGKILNVGRCVPHGHSERNIAPQLNTGITGAVYLYYKLLNPEETVNITVIN